MLTVLKSNVSVPDPVTTSNALIGTLGKLAVPGPENVKSLMLPIALARFRLPAPVPKLPVALVTRNWPGVPGVSTGTAGGGTHDAPLQAMKSMDVADTKLV